MSVYERVITSALSSWGTQTLSVSRWHLPVGRRLSCSPACAHMKTRDARAAVVFKLRASAWPGRTSLAGLGSWSGPVPDPLLSLSWSSEPLDRGRVDSACSQGTLRRPRLTGALLLSGPQSSWGGQPTSPLSIWLQAMATYQLSQKLFALRIESECQSEV